MVLKTYSVKHLRHAIIRSLRKQGYVIKRGILRIPKNPSKDDYRALNEMAVRKKFEKSGPGVQRYEDDLLTKYIANGRDVEPRATVDNIPISAT